MQHSCGPACDAPPPSRMRRHSRLTCPNAPNVTGPCAGFAITLLAEAEPRYRLIRLRHTSFVPGPGRPLCRSSLQQSRQRAETRTRTARIARRNGCAHQRRLRFLFSSGRRGAFRRCRSNGVALLRTRTIGRSLERAFITSEVMHKGLACKAPARLCGAGCVATTRVAAARRSRSAV